MNALPKPSVMRLTPRRLEVLKLVCQGYSTKKIAELLGIAPNTVSCHRDALREISGAHNAVQLAQWASTLQTKRY